MSNIEKNITQFSQRYSFEKRNYNIIIHSPDATGKYDFIIEILKNYYESRGIKKIDNIDLYPDVFYLSLPLYNKSGKQERVLNNYERLLFEFGLEEKFDNSRIGSDISIEQIRELKEFTNLSPTYDHKFVVINNCNYLNNQSSAALLKTLEETNSPCIFLLLASELESVKDTIKSRCHFYKYDYEDSTDDYDSHFDYYTSTKPGLKTLHNDNGYLDDFDLFEDELSKLHKNELDPLNLSFNWAERGSLCIDYLLSIFYILMKGFALDDQNSLHKIYGSLSRKIPIDSSRAINIIRILYKFKIDFRANLNKKLFYDNLLIVLNKELY